VLALVRSRLARRAGRPQSAARPIHGRERRAERRPTSTAAPGPLHPGRRAPGLLRDPPHHAARDADRLPDPIPDARERRRVVLL